MRHVCPEQAWISPFEPIYQSMFLCNFLRVAGMGPSSVICKEQLLMVQVADVYLQSFTSWGLAFSRADDFLRNQKNGKTSFDKSLSPGPF